MSHVNDLQVGDRIRLVAMPDDPCPIRPGTEGTVSFVNELWDSWQITVAWDNGRSLALVVPPDQFEIV